MYATDQRSGIEAPAATAGAAGWSAPAPGLADAVDALGEAVSLLASVDLEAEDDQALLDASVELQRLANRSAGQQVRILERVDAQAAFSADGAVTAALNRPGFAGDADPTEGEDHASTQEVSERVA